MIKEKFPSLAKYFQNCIARIDLIDLPEEQATRNYVNAITPDEKQRLAESMKQVIAEIDQYMGDINKLGRCAFSSPADARRYLELLLAAVN